MIYVGKLTKLIKGETIIERYFHCEGPDCFQKIRVKRFGKSRKVEPIYEFPPGLDSRLYW